MNLDPDVVSGFLAPLVTRLSGRVVLTPTERTEMLRIAQGLGAKDSAAASNVSPETVRARRKRMYRKLGMTGGANEVVASLLALSLEALARPEGSAATAPVGDAMGEATSASR
jgi:DNA-binding CsgD family transcriptional regulator